MKVLFVTTQSTIDHCYTMIKELRSHAELSVFITAKEMTDEIKEYCAFSGAVFFRRASFKNPFGLFRDLHLLREIKKNGADLVWFSGMSFYQALLVRLFVKNFIINLHDVELHPEEKDYHGIFTQKIIYFLYKKNIAVMSRSQADIFKKKFNREPLVLQLPIIDYYQSVSPNAERHQVKPGMPVRFFFFGTIMPYKGIEILIDAADILTSKSVPFELNIYGKLAYGRKNIKERISANKNITLIDKYIDYSEVASVFASNDVLVVPYKQVSQCGPLLIAYAGEIPVIGSNLPGFAEYIADNKSGYIYNNSASGLAEKMEYVIANPAVIEQLSNFIKKDISNNFSMNSLAESYLISFNKYLSKEN
jgi:glycosyltransferase involved in cell wall biosynthesis